MFNWWKRKLNLSHATLKHFSFTKRKKERRFPATASRNREGCFDAWFQFCGYSSLPFKHVAFNKWMEDWSVCLHSDELYFRFIIVNPFKFRLNFITSQLQKQILAMNRRRVENNSQFQFLDGDYHKWCHNIFWCKIYFEANDFVCYLRKMFSTLKLFNCLCDMLFTKTPLFNWCLSFVRDIERWKFDLKFVKWTNEQGCLIIAHLCKVWGERA